MQTKTVRVVRAFYFHGKATKVGDVVDLPHVFALEMIAAHKAVSAERPKPEPPKSEHQKQTEDPPRQANGGKYAR